MWFDTARAPHILPHATGVSPGFTEPKVRARHNKTHLHARVTSRPPNEHEYKRLASNSKHEQADQARPNRRRPRLISQCAAKAQAGQAAGGGSDDPEILHGAAFFRLAGARLAADFFRGGLLAGGLLAVVLLAEVFFAEAFFTAPLRVAFLATTLRRGLSSQRPSSPVSWRRTSSPSS